MLSELKETLIESSIEFVNEYKELGLSIFCYTEGFINPIPAAFIVGPLAVPDEKLFPLWLLFFLAFTSNILGGMTGYFLGDKLGHPVGVKFFGQKKMDKAEAFFNKWGEWGVVIAAFTPLPYKVAAWAAGIFEMNFWKFLIASLIGRALHFVAIIAAFYYGSEGLKMLMGA